MGFCGIIIRPDRPPIAVCQANKTGPSGEIGIHVCLRSICFKRAGSSPVSGTKPSSVLKSLVKDVFKRFLPSEGDLIFVVNF